MQFNNGEHGFDNSAMDMKTIFRAVGPSFRRGLQVEPFESVHVYELLCKLLGIVPEANDGHLSTLLPMLTSEAVDGGPSTSMPTTTSGEALRLHPRCHQAAAGGRARPVSRVPTSCVGRLSFPVPDIPTTPGVAGHAPHLSSAGDEPAGRAS